MQRKPAAAPVTALTTAMQSRCRFRITGACPLAATGPRRDVAEHGHPAGGQMQPQPPEAIQLAVLRLCCTCNWL